MLNFSELYPCSNQARRAQLLDGMWKFRFDPEEKGLQEGWQYKLPDPISMPVPASFSDLFTTKEERDFCGDFWYETEVFIPREWEKQEVEIRFGSITHRASVYCNGSLTAAHEGGFLPVVARVTDHVKFGEVNTFIVKANNELNEENLPCGATMVLSDGRKLAKPYFDFFNYSGIQRSVWLVSKPVESIEDFSVDYELNGEDAVVHYQIMTNGDHEVSFELFDENKQQVAKSAGTKGSVTVSKAHLWNVGKAYLYQAVVRIWDGETLIDEYSSKIGIRTVKIAGKEIQINGKAVYLKGFGKHEDFEVIGRGFNWGVLKRDFECMKWIGANCFRTSHYPYAEEWYQFADEEGFLIIDEVPAVGMMRSTRNFADAGTGKFTRFFETPTVPNLLKNHLQAVEEMIVRDKNHPSVIAWSLFNEPETTSEESKDYFAAVFDAARALDPQNRPMTGAFEKNSQPELCKCYQLCDFICLNRYYGWYIKGGPELVDAREAFLIEMNKWKDKNLNIPFVFTEFGTDTMAAEHKLPSIMWSQEYQNEYLDMNFEIFDQFEFVQGELVWNFADFQTTEGIMRVNGNKKGIFNRVRQPKSAAFVLKKRWESMN